MDFKTILLKIPAILDSNNVIYHFPIDGEIIDLNSWIGCKIAIHHTGIKICQDCQKSVKKFYGQGLCYVCTMSSPTNSPCIINPELCEAHLGKGRDVEWEQRNHLQPHAVYLANSGGLKVGVTRMDQIPTRWIDQGADQAIILAITPYRMLAGQIEVMLKGYISDKTNWRKMLSNIRTEEINLADEKQKIIQLLSAKFQEFVVENNTIYELNFPTPQNTGSIISYKLDTKPTLEGTLTGIKGQYLILDQKNVINIRNHIGYEVIISI